MKHLGTSGLKFANKALKTMMLHRRFRGDFDLEAFSRSPTDGSFAVLVCQLIAITKYLNKVFLSY